MRGAGDPPFDVSIVGSGAAGVSCAHPLVAAGRRVAMVDGGRLPSANVPVQPYMDYRRSAADQGPILFGTDYGTAETAADASPKLRVPQLRYVFEGFAEAYGLRTNGFTHAGSLAVGGMTNAWGAGVSCFTEEDFAGWPIRRSDLVDSYRAVVKRIGVSGSCDDDLRDFFAWHEDLQSPGPLDPAADLVLRRYSQSKARQSADGFLLGRARNAILFESSGDRLPCDHSGWCLWGCSRRSIYSARYELEVLARHPNFTHLPGRIIEGVARLGESCVVRGRGPLAGERFELGARQIALACGPVGTATLVLRALHLIGREIRFCSCPSAAFAVVLPRLVGRSLPERVFASAQLSLLLRLSDLRSPLFGNIFSPASLPVSEFIARSPLPTRSSIAFFRATMPALLVGNLFMPGDLSDHALVVRPDDGIDVRWGYTSTLDERFERRVRRALAKALRTCGAFLLPGAFKTSTPGSDMHYGATVPMHAEPAAHQATREGEVKGLPGIFVVDGSALPSLPAKAHTLTLMANADRIARIIDRRLG